MRSREMLETENWDMGNNPEGRELYPGMAGGKEKQRLQDFRW